MKQFYLIPICLNFIYPNVGQQFQIFRMLFFLIGYIWLGSILLTVILVKVFIPEDSFALKSIKKNRVMMFRRYILAPPVIICLWPIILFVIIYLPYHDKWWEKKQVVKRMKEYINNSNTTKLKNS